MKQSAIDLISAIDFSSLSIDEISVIEDADKLPDDVSLKILKAWMHKQNDVLSNIRGKLLYTPQIEVAEFEQFINTMKCPSSKCNSVVENILYQIATGGGSFKPSCIVNTKEPETSLIEVDQKSSNNSSNSHIIDNLFDFSNDTYYIGPSLDNSYITITLPPFLKVNLTSYTLTAPPRLNQTGQGGIKSWKVYGYNQANNEVLLDNVNNDSNLSHPSSTHTYEVRYNENQYFRSFKILNAGPNHQNNQSIILSGFDISGNLIIEDD